MSFVIWLWAYTRYSFNAVTMLVHRLRRWPTIETALRNASCVPGFYGPINDLQKIECNRQCIIILLYMVGHRWIFVSFVVSAPKVQSTPPQARARKWSNMLFYHSQNNGTLRRKFAFALMYFEIIKIVCFIIFAFALVYNNSTLN